MNTINIGIDLGTTNSGVASFVNGNLTVYKNAQSLKETISSAVAYRSDKIFIGDKARELVTKDVNNVFMHFKRKMGTDYKYYIQSRDSYTDAIELSALILTELKNSIQDINDKSAVVITIPAAFDTIQSNATKNAGYKAGFEEVILLQEPIAASIAYANKTGINIDNENWIVYDLGGGTFDIALVGVVDGELKVIDHEGDNYLGGSDFDKLIVENIILPKLVLQGLNLNKNGSEAEQQQYEQIYFQLLFKAEEAKKELSRSELSEIEFSINQDGLYKDYFIDITRIEFESAILAIIERTLDLTEKVIVRSKIPYSNIKNILLVGGSTYVPLVKNKLHEKFNISVSNDVDVITAVMCGAAYFAGTKIKNNLSSKIELNYSQSSQGQFDIKMAYNKVTTSTQEPLLIACKNISQPLMYRVTRNDFGFDSGLVNLTDSVRELLNVVPNNINTFKLEIFDTKGSLIEPPKEITITHGKFSLLGQPLPHDICIELDSPEDGTSYLELIFKKNDILPLKKSIVKKIAKTIVKKSADKFSLNILEGNWNDIPEANKLIGKLSIDGSQIDRDIIKDTDVEIDFYMSESRDITVKIYLRLSDQEFENVFSPQVFNIETTDLILELNSLRQEIKGRISEFEKSENYEEAFNATNLINEMEQLIHNLKTMDHKTDFDEKFKIETRKREIASIVGKNYKSTLSSKLIEEYLNIKWSCENYLKLDTAKPTDQIDFEAITKNDAALIKESNISKLRKSINDLKSIITMINNRKELTIQELINYFVYFKSKQYSDTNSANKFISEGEEAINEQNTMKLSSALTKLVTLHSKENPEDKSDTYNIKTGLK